MVSPFPTHYQPNPLRDQWNRKIGVFRDNMPNTMSLLYLTRGCSKWSYQVLASPSSKT